MEKKLKLEDEEDQGNYYVYAFKDSQINDLYFGHGTVKSRNSREWQAINPSEKTDKDAVC